MNWKYSINIVSRLMEMTRYEIKAFNPNGRIPNNFLFESISWDGWESSFGEERTRDGSFNLKWMYATKQKSDFEFYISIDRWGLLSGTVICMEDVTDEMLGHVHSLLSLMDNLVWG